MRRTVEDQFAHRLAGRGGVEHAPDTMAGRHVGAVNTRHGADQGKAVLSDRPEARLRRLDRRRGEIFRHSASSRARAPLSASAMVANTPSGPGQLRINPKMRLLPPRGNGGSNFFRLDNLLVGNLLIPQQERAGPQLCAWFRTKRLHDDCASVSAEAYSIAPIWRAS
jgi:hypothetical protein